MMGKIWQKSYRRNLQELLYLMQSGRRTDSCIADKPEDRR